MSRVWSVRAARGIPPRLDVCYPISVPSPDYEWIWLRLPGPDIAGIIIRKMCSHYRHSDVRTRERAEREGPGEGGMV